MMNIEYPKVITPETAAAYIAACEAELAEEQRNWDKKNAQVEATYQAWLAAGVPKMLNYRRPNTTKPVSVIIRCAIAQKVGLRERPHSLRHGVEMIKKELEQIERKKWEEDTDAKNAEYTTRCIKWLLEHGKTVGTDFDVSNVVSVAEESRRQELVDEAIKECRVFTGFGCDECDKWFAGEHRCQCGNRRVDFVREGDLDNMYLRAEAY